MKPAFLIGVDGSEGAKRAVQFATERARREDARLILAHVVDWSPYAVITPEAAAGRQIEREREIADAKQKILEPLRTLTGDLEVEMVVRHGHATEKLCELAKEHGVVQMFLGRRGRSKLAALVFGSVSGGLVQAAPVPVTVVP